MKRNANKSIFQQKFESEAKGEDEAKEKEFPTLNVEPGDNTVTIEKEEEAHNMPMVPGGVMCEVKADGLEVRQISEPI